MESPVATIAFICSAIYHLFCCYSHYVRDILVKVDYIGITIFITGSFMTWLYYAFHGETSQNCVYLYAICFGGLLVGILTQLDHFNARESRGHRAGIYVIFGLSLTIPAILLFQKSCKSRQTTKIISSVIYTTIIYMTGGFIYTTRLTERLWPGKVDIIGHSHQIFHVIVVIASIVHEKMIVFIATTNEEMVDTKKWLL
uniref:Uncharacterized protein n=1 Tax=Tetranychus urticae TaxID=32264 RepID=T1KN21_TETUR